jgi:hypothetical protein
MDKTLIVGISVIIVAYAITWAFIIISNKIINKMNNSL